MKSVIPSTISQSLIYSLPFGFLPSLLCPLCSGPVEKFQHKLLFTIDMYIPKITHHKMTINVLEPFLL